MSVQLIFQGTWTGVMMAIDDKSAGMTPFERRITAQVDYLGAIALTIARRLGWCVLLLALLVGGCVNTLRILHDR